MKAHDGDRGINNPIKYSLTKRNAGPFDIDETTGVVFTTSELDREASINNGENGAYILEIVAKEISKVSVRIIEFSFDSIGIFNIANYIFQPIPSAKTEITIILTDVNDEIPTFHSSYYEAEINENAQENSPLRFLLNTRNQVYDHDQVSEEVKGVVSTGLVIMLSMSIAGYQRNV